MSQSNKNKDAQSEHNYKNTLNLPETAFAMRANLPTKEPKIVAFWESIDIYQKQRAAFKGKPKFVLHDGPPYANGALHLGHFVNKTLKDIIVKSRGQLGYDSPYVPGWDCHGLPIELVVEKKHGKVGPKLSASEFRVKCHDFALTQIALQKKGFKRFGVIGDYDRPYLTLNKKTEADIVRALSKIVENGHLERGSRPVNWCLDCGSSLAEAEVEYADKASASIDVAFKVADIAVLKEKIATEFAGNDVAVIIWTTTPWTLPGNEAVSVHPEYDYVLAQFDQRMIIVAEAMVDSLAARWGKPIKPLQTFKGAVLEHLALIHPLYSDKQVPVILGEHVTLDGGTGCVHTAPAHGDDDYKVGLKYNLPMSNPVLGNGNYSLDVGLFAGQNIRTIDESMLAALTSAGTLIFHSTIHHSYPHCWRHKSPTIFRATAQWFISMDNKGLRSNILDEINKVEFTPNWGQARLYGMIEGRGDWCISRQRYWGVPIPFFLHKETNELHPDTINLLEQVAKRIEEKGIAGWFDAEVSDFLTQDADLYEKNPDTLDVWFDSGTTHYSVLSQRDELHYPADLYLEGSDQHRGWFNSSICTSVAMNGIAPYKALLTHGFTVDAQGRKMSKSLGNGIEPDEVMNKLGADILRLWVSSTDYRGEIPVSDEILTRTSETYRRIRNTIRFLLANTGEFDYHKDVLPMTDLLPLDRWIVARAHTLQAEIGKDYTDYAFHHVYQKIHHFCSIDLGSFYIDIIKDRQYTCAKDSIARRSCQTALYHILEALIRWMAPVLSFTAEEVWQEMRSKDETRPESIFLVSFYEQLVPLDASSKFTGAFWDELIALRSEVAKEVELLRAEGRIGSSLQANVTLYCSEALLAQLSLLEDELRFVLLTSYVTLQPLTQKPEARTLHGINGQHSYAIGIDVSEYKKCVRCWHYREEIGHNSQHPELCDRCITNLTPQGEERHYA